MTQKGEVTAMLTSPFSMRQVVIQELGLPGKGLEQ